MNILRNRRSLREDHGSATVEFAVILPALLLILMGIVEFGRVMMVQQMLTTAAREGARIASLPGADNTEVLARITQELANAGLSGEFCELTPSDITTASRHDPVTVRVQLDYNAIAWIPGFIPGMDSLQLEGVVVMRKEGFI